MMNFLLLLIDAVGSFIRRNPIFCLAVLLLALFAPALLQGLARIAFFAVLGIVCFWAGVLLWLRWRLGRMRKEMGERFEEQSRRTNGGGSWGFGGRPAGSEGEVKIHRTTGAPEKRVKGDVGDYVDFEETKEEKR